MVVEARYAAGDAVLIGSGAHWLLMTDPGDEGVVAEFWQLIGAGGDGLLERVLALAMHTFDGAPPALAMVDFTTGAATAVSRGAGQVTLDGPARILSVDGAGSARVPALRRLLGGVANASRVELRPITRGATAVPAAPPAAPGRLPVAGLIDGIPDDILRASRPEGPPPVRPRAVPRDTAEDTGSLNDTTDPVDGDLPEQIEHHPDATVLAFTCPLGHPTPTTSPACRVCHQRVAPQEPQWIPRPALGGLRLPTGEVVPLDRGVVIGRKPTPPPGSVDWPHLVHLPSGQSFVSRCHLQIELDGWDVLARDLGSRGGSCLTAPGRDTVRMQPGEAYVLEPGAVVDLAEVYEVRFEIGRVAGR